MTEALQMNDEAARSPTGEILDQATTPATTETKPSGDQTQTTETQSKPDTTTEPAKDGSTVLTAKDKTEPKPSAAPDKYTDFKAPDGYTLDPATIEAATPIFKELGLSQDAAQKLVDFHATQ